ncbi:MULTISPECIES: cystine ABC transporter substrate-binding protein [Pseudomonas]|uniref:Cystine transport system substrate-binding protein n=1 Tax=Pseudomonas lutea TaxID=243924 RepID=A0A9X8MDT4_9PSED|nr:MULTISPECIES: cystine ABC transporter substrate-binding protein [Pseudomonas]SEQ74887.1 cystine transport system substrate-binding protein [Pseudomonas lutea]
MRTALRRYFTFASLALALGISVNAYAEDLLKEVKQRGTLVIGLEGTYPPFSYQDENGKLTGFEVEFAQALAKEMGVQPKIQPGKWDGLLAALDSKRLDVVINQVTISEERKKKYDFSTPYTVSGVQAMTRKNEQDTIKKPEDLANKKVGVGLGTNYEQWLKENVPQADVRTYEDDPTKFQDLRVGRIDAVLVDRLAAFEMAAKTGNQFVPAGEPFNRQESGVAERKGNPEFHAAIDQAIAKMKADGTLAKLSQKWFKADVTQ